MKICIYGQGTGGNAALWFNYFNNEYVAPEDILLISRTVCTLNAKFKVIRVFGAGKLNKFFYKFYAPLASRIILRFVLLITRMFYKPSGLVLQGNYTPSINLSVLNTLKTKSILNIYGSDFYRKYLLNEFSIYEKKCFVDVLDSVDRIAFNWESTYNDFLNEFPELKSKCFVNPWGINSIWKEESNLTPFSFGWPKADKIFLSTRAIAKHNNIDVVVESFCKVYKNNKNVKLFIVSGYGNDNKFVAKVKSIVSKYGADDKVIFKINQWITDEELISLYQYSDYNFCFGSTDQLTVSIPYALVKKSRNILSPIDNYQLLLERGYSSPIIAERIDVESLCSLLESLENKSSGHEIVVNTMEHDSLLAKREFDMNTTFLKYLNYFKEQDSI